MFKIFTYINRNKAQHIKITYDQVHDRETKIPTQRRNKMVYTFYYLACTPLTDNWFSENGDLSELV
jgi:hypothetical protein